MTITRLEGAPGPDLAQALETFERQFRYPLGPEQSFRISHGRDYSRFFRAMGPQGAASFIAVEASGTVLGTLGVALRPLRLPGGQVPCVAYLGDLKTAPGPRRGRTLVALSAAATDWSRKNGAVAAYGVVMGGTAHLPPDYSGKCGILPFDALHELVVLRLTTESPLPLVEEGFAATEPELEHCFRQLSENARAPLGGCAEERSEFAPVRLVAPDGSACGVIEDTRRAKRLFLDGGAELLSAHLGKFAYADPAAGARLLGQALARCAAGALGPALFVAVPKADQGEFAALLAHRPTVIAAPATIYGTGLDLGGQRWNVSTSEI